ncbi:hypothetical protein [Microlunatus speluncae]|nr:hypothetical protein [Microlunatus speluncae]
MTIEADVESVVIIADSVDQLERLSSLFAMAAVSLRTAQAETEQAAGGEF